MTLIHLDPVGGVAGDMFVAALLDAFPELTDRVAADAATVLPAGAGRPVLEERESGGIRAARFGLSLSGAAHGGSGEGADGSYRALAALIGAAPLSPGTSARAIGILTILAEAEARIHGVAIDDVHFHEIAGWDSLLDMVAAGSIAAALDGARWTVSALPRGGGMVRTEHGLLSVPAPATALILEGFVWRDDGIPGEQVTPTGAAILKHLVSEILPGTEGRLTATGTGAGTRTLAGIPNVLRALVFEGAAMPSEDRVTVMAFEVDDMTGEEIGVAAGRLRAAEGVLDLSIGQRWGKKDRPLQSFQLIVRPELAETVVRRCFTETSTIGLRVREERRVVLAREERVIDDIGIKSVLRPVVGATRKAESDDLRGDSLTARRAEKARVEGEGR